MAIWKQGARTLRLELRDIEFKTVASAAPTSATLTASNGTNGSVTFTSLKGQVTGNATTVTLSFDTNTAAVSLSGTDITVKLHSSDTNASNIDTTASNVKTLMDANSNIAALVTTTTNTAGVMTTKVKTDLSGGDDKLTTSLVGPGCTFLRNSKGSYTLTLSDSRDSLFDFAGAWVDVSSSVVGSGSGVAKVEVIPAASSAITSFTVQFFDYAGALVDVSGASVIRGHLFGQRNPCKVDGSLIKG